MLRPYYRHSHRSPYGLHRFHRMRPTAIRYPRSRLFYRPMMMHRPVFYPSPIPAKRNGFFDKILAMLAVLFCLNRNRTGRRAISSGSTSAITSVGGGGVTSGGIAAGGDIGGSSSCGGGGPSSCAGGSSSCGGGGGSCGGGGGGGGSCGGGGGGGGSCGGGGGGGN